MDASNFQQAHISNVSTALASELLSRVGCPQPGLYSVPSQQQVLLPSSYNAVEAAQFILTLAAMDSDSTLSALVPATAQPAPIPLPFLTAYISSSVVREKLRNAFYTQPSAVTTSLDPTSPTDPTPDSDSPAQDPLLSAAAAGLSRELYGGVSFLNTAPEYTVSWDGLRSLSVDKYTAPRPANGAAEARPPSCGVGIVRGGASIRHVHGDYVGAAFAACDDVSPEWRAGGVVRSTTVGLAALRVGEALSLATPTPVAVALPTPSTTGTGASSVQARAASPSSPAANCANGDSGSPPAAPQAPSRTLFVIQSRTGKLVSWPSADGASSPTVMVAFRPGTVFRVGPPLTGLPLSLLHSSAASTRGSWGGWCPTGAPSPEPAIISCASQPPPPASAPADGSAAPAVAPSSGPAAVPPSPPTVVVLEEVAFDAGPLTTAGASVRSISSALTAAERDAFGGPLDAHITLAGRRLMMGAGGVSSVTAPATAIQPQDAATLVSVVVNAVARRCGGSTVDDLVAVASDRKEQDTATVAKAPTTAPACGCAPTNGSATTPVAGYDADPHAAPMLRLLLGIMPTALQLANEADDPGVTDAAPLPPSTPRHWVESLLSSRCPRAAAVVVAFARARGLPVIPCLLPERLVAGDVNAPAAAGALAGALLDSVPSALTASHVIDVMDDVYAAVRDESSRCAVATTAARNKKSILHLCAEAQPVRCDGDDAVGTSARCPVRRWVARGCDVNATDHLDFTPLHVAAKDGHVDAIVALAESGANVDAKDGVDGTPALHYAAVNGHIDAITALCRFGASVDAADDNGESALHFAARGGQFGSVQSLLAAGANLLKSDPFGNTAAMWARRDGQHRMADWLEREAARMATSPANTPVTESPPTLL